jgi:hypothetical protein
MTREQLLQYLHTNPIKISTRPKDLKVGDVIEGFIGMRLNIQAIKYWEIKTIELSNRKYYIEMEGITGQGAPVRDGFYIKVTSPEKHISVVDGRSVYEKVIINQISKKQLNR